MAPGSQKEKGNCADFVNAPRNTSTSATETIVPSGGLDTRSVIDVVPLAMKRSTNPASIASPPAVVTRMACKAASLASARSSSKPTNRYDATVVTSQNTNSPRSSSEATMPAIPPVKISSRARKRTRRDGSVK